MYSATNFPNLPMIKSSRVLLHPCKDHILRIRGHVEKYVSQVANIWVRRVTPIPPGLGTAGASDVAAETMVFRWHRQVTESPLPLRPATDWRVRMTSRQKGRIRACWWRVIAYNLGTRWSLKLHDAEKHFTIYKQEMKLTVTGYLFGAVSCHDWRAGVGEYESHMFKNFYL